MTKVWTVIRTECEDAWVVDVFSSSESANAFVERLRVEDETGWTNFLVEEWEVKGAVMDAPILRKEFKSFIFGAEIPRLWHNSKWRSPDSDLVTELDECNYKFLLWLPASTDEVEAEQILQEKQALYRQWKAEGLTAGEMLQRFNERD